MTNRRLRSVRSPSSGAQRSVKMHSAGGRTLEEVKEALSITQVIGDFIQLEPAGISQVCCCPFVPEDTPSFNVYEAERKWVCYSCRASGDIYDFVQRMQHCSLREALNYLEVRYLGSVVYRASGGLSGESSSTPGHSVAQAEYTGSSAAQVTSESGQEPLLTSERKSHRVDPDLIREVPELQDVMDRALGAYVAGLRNAQNVVKSYALQRGISPELAKKLHIGYSSGFTLANALRSLPEVRQRARECELINDQNADRLASRLIVPEIRGGHVIFLIGRSIPPPESLAPATASPRSPHSTERGNGKMVYFPGAETSSGLTKDPTSDVSDPASPAAKRRNKYILVGPRLLLGLGMAEAALAAGPIPGVLAVEGVIDWALPQDWQLPLPVLSILGTYASAAQLQELVSFMRKASKVAGYPVPVVIGLDTNAEGQRAIPVLEMQLAAEQVRTCRLPLLVGGEDLGDLGKAGASPAGRLAFIDSLAPLLFRPLSQEDEEGQEQSTDVMGNEPRTSAHSG